ncbi:MAG: hypothetical protein WC042_00485 [Candidatus Paceibacterota bacterium]|jgi:ribulose-phosphate 3-epimerase|nr:hypothetical protein [Candidatus Paceibacterota bacterium]MDD3548357.1 hypothetical protein [Candidatus Paceibacterota bacterium]MDD4998883.1 hypothetical protein [Candidatus Paceibacterota bacterium]MDD5545116.1 hypothetical protein [Candidatus Paceibacterota bacterium]
MIEIIPVINVKTRQKLEEKIRFLLANFKGIFQIDVADGIFTSWKNWNFPEDLKRAKKIKKHFELHLMIANVEEVLNNWLEIDPKRVIVHQEVIKNFDFIFDACKKKQIELGIALNPETPIKEAEKYLKKINFVLLLAVSPGPSGQTFKWFVLDKVKELRKKYPKIDIALDGGINEEIALKAKEAGANILAIGSAIFESKDPMGQIKKFKEILS